MAISEATKDNFRNAFTECATGEPAMRVTLGSQIAGEDVTNNVMQVVNKPSAASTYAGSIYKNIGASVTQNIKSTSGNLYAFVCHNNNATGRYLQFHNTSTTPSAGAVPELSFWIPATSEVSKGYGDIFGFAGYNFSTGIAIAISTTRDTYTAAGATDCATRVRYA